MATPGTSSTGTKIKRKRVVLSIRDKLEIIALLDQSISYTVICERFGIGKSTVGDIKKNKEKIISFENGHGQHE